MRVSTLPEIHLYPEDMKHIIELAARHHSDIAARLDESYHLARFDVFDNPDRVRFICHSLTREEAVQIQHWLHMALMTADSNATIERLTRLSDEWRAVSADVE